MADLGDLYQEVLLDHYKKPRNFGKMDGSVQQAEGHNPLCGDHCTVYVRLEAGTIADVRFEGTGCAISVASASLMTVSVKGKERVEAERLFGQVHELVTGTFKGDPADLGKLACLSGVSDYPVRVKCASLAWHTLKAALEAGGSVTTE